MILPSHTHPTWNEQQSGFIAPQLSIAASFKSLGRCPRQNPNSNYLHNSKDTLGVANISPRCVLAGQMISRALDFVGFRCPCRAFLWSSALLHYGQVTGILRLLSEISITRRLGYRKRLKQILSHTYSKCVAQDYYTSVYYSLRS